VRELENFMERMSILVDGDVVQPIDLPAKILETMGDIAVLPEPASHPEPTRPLQQQGFVWPTLADLDAHAMSLKDFLDAIEDKLIEEALERSDGVKNQAAELLGITRTTLIAKLKTKPG
jgi:DNA-binding NtrC family response regulator